MTTRKILPLLLLSFFLTPATGVSAQCIETRPPNKAAGVTIVLVGENHEQDSDLARIPSIISAAETHENRELFYFEALRQNSSSYVYSQAFLDFNFGNPTIYGADLRRGKRSVLDPARQQANS